MMKEDVCFDVDGL